MRGAPKDEAPDKDQNPDPLKQAPTTVLFAVPKTALERIQLYVNEDGSKHYLKEGDTYREFDIDVEGHVLRKRGSLPATSVTIKVDRSVELPNLYKA